MRKIIIISAIFGYVFVLLATGISTIQIPKIDKEISKVEEEIDGLYARRERGVLFSLNYRQNEILKRINYIELNNLILHNVGDEQQRLISGVILSQMKRLKVKI